MQVSDSATSMPTCLMSHATRIPVELVRIVFEFAAQESPVEAANLMCISKTVREWIAPLLYHTVILQTPNSVASFYETIHTAKSPFACHVTQLYLPPAPSPGVPLSFLTNFPALQHLAISSISLRYPSHSSCLQRNSPRPTSITITGPLARISFEHPIFRVVTHLHLADDTPMPFALTSQVFPRLTHLACGYRHGYSSLTSVTSLPLLLAQTKALTGPHTNTDGEPEAPVHRTSLVRIKVLVVELYLSDGNPDATMFVMQRLGWEKNASKSDLRADPRLVVKPGKALTPKRWENYVLSNVLWSSAEQKIKIQRQCEIDLSRM